MQTMLVTTKVGQGANNTKNYKTSAIKWENLILELRHANNFLD